MSKVLVSLLDIIGYAVPISAMSQWSPDDFKQVEKWATANFLLDNGHNVTVPKIPKVIKKKIDFYRKRKKINGI